MALVDQYQQFLIFLEVFLLFSFRIEVVSLAHEQLQQPYVRQYAVFQSLLRLDSRNPPKITCITILVTSSLFRITMSFLVFASQSDFSF